MIYLVVSLGFPFAFLCGAGWGRSTAMRQHADVDTERLVSLWARERTKMNPRLRVVK